MATSGNGRKSGGKTKSSASSKKSTSAKRGSTKKKQDEGFAYKNEAIMLGVFVLLIFIFLCIVRVISGGEGKNNLGDYIRIFFTGIFGISAYYLPLAAIGLTILFRIINRDRAFYLRFAAIVVLMVMFGVFSHLITYGVHLDELLETGKWGGEFYNNGNGGGFLFGAITMFLVNIVGRVGSVFVAVILTLVCLAVFLIPFIPAIIEFAQREREEDDEEEDEEEYEQMQLDTSKNAAKSKTVRDRIVDHDLSKLHNHLR